MTRAVTAVACSNIALVKYWGKSAQGDNRTAVPSLSLTLAAMKTTTELRFDDTLAQDRLRIGGSELSGRPRERVARLLDEVRRLAGISARVEMNSHNDFPTASGLASSASGFAALALAAQAAAGLDLGTAAISALARRASASAARSLFGGFVELLADADAATEVVPGDFIDVRMVIAVTTLGPKDTGSTDGMLHTQATSPYYPAWVELAPRVFADAKQALLRRDLEALGVCMEHSTLAMHASMLAATPGLFYWRDASLRAIDAVRALRAQGVLAYFTLDAGPHVKVLTPSADAARVADALGAVPGVERVLLSEPGPAASLVEG